MPENSVAAPQPGAMRLSDSSMSFTNEGSSSSYDEDLDLDEDLIHEVRSAKIQEDLMIDRQSWHVQESSLLFPWSPKRIETLTTFLVAFSLYFVLPFGFTRARTGRWTGYFFPQACINWLLESLGFQPFFQGDTLYLAYATDQENSERQGIDVAFAIHITCGVLWIVVGGLQ